MPSSKSITSKYVLYVSNVSGDTRTKDIRCASLSRRIFFWEVVRRLSFVC